MLFFQLTLVELDGRISHIQPSDTRNPRIF